MAADARLAVENRPEAVAPLGPGIVARPDTLEQFMAERTASHPTGDRAEPAFGFGLMKASPWERHSIDGKFLRRECRAAGRSPGSWAPACGFVGPGALDCDERRSPWLMLSASASRFLATGAGGDSFCGAAATNLVSTGELWRGGSAGAWSGDRQREGNEQGCDRSQCEDLVGNTDHGGERRGSQSAHRRSDEPCCRLAGGKADRGTSCGRGPASIERRPALTSRATW